MFRKGAPKSQTRKYIYVYVCLNIGIYIFFVFEIFVSRTLAEKKRREKKIGLV